MNSAALIYRTAGMGGTGLGTDGAGSGVSALRHCPEDWAGERASFTNGLETSAKLTRVVSELGVSRLGVRGPWDSLSASAGYVVALPWQDWAPSQVQQPCPGYSLTLSFI